MIPDLWLLMAGRDFLDLHAEHLCFIRPFRFFFPFFFFFFCDPMFGLIGLYHPVGDMSPS